MSFNKLWRPCGFLCRLPDCGASIPGQNRAPKIELPGFGWLAGVFAWSLPHSPAESLKSKHTPTLQDERERLISTTHSRLKTLPSIKSMLRVGSVLTHSHP